MKKIIVASLNPVKIEAARQAFLKAFPDEVFVFEGVAAKSGVSDQPLSNEETYLGALNRVKSAQVLYQGADFYISFEGGVADVNGILEEFAWIVVSDNSRTSHSRSASFSDPKALRDLVIDKGLEMGEAADIVFNDTNIKQKMGVVGCLSKGLINRSDLYVQPAILALLPFVNPNLYADVRT
jgi:inosine/xanthosine triphosphatase